MSVHQIKGLYPLEIIAGWFARPSSFFTFTQVSCFQVQEKILRLVRKLNLGLQVKCLFCRPSLKCNSITQRIHEWNGCQQRRLRWCILGTQLAGSFRVGIVRYRKWKGFPSIYIYGVVQQGNMAKFPLYAILVWQVSQAVENHYIWQLAMTSSLPQVNRNPHNTPCGGLS